MKFIKGIKGQIIDLTGKQFGRLTVLAFGDRIKSGKNIKVRWKCICQCGKEILARGDQLRTGNTTSCGCINKEKLIKNNKKRRISDQQKGEKDQLCNYKWGAKHRKLEWKLTDQQALDIFNQNCFYCNTKPLERPINAVSHIGQKYEANGIDRLNNDLGYTVENSVSCCEKCNRAKHKMSVSEFYNWLNKIMTSSCIIPFYLYRNIDVSGTSGTGIVASGVIMPSGKAILEWFGEFKTDTIFESIEQVHKIHSHNSKTSIILGNYKFHEVLESMNQLNIFQVKEEENESK